MDTVLLPLGAKHKKDKLPTGARERFLAKFKKIGTAVAYLIRRTTDFENT